MLTKKKKLSRKEMKEDKLISFYYKAYGYFEENKSKVFTYIAAVVVAIGLAAFYVNHRIQNNKAAGVELAKVMDLYDNGSYLEAIEGKQGTELVGLKKIVQDYGSTENGEYAKVYLANSYNRLGKFDEALKYYEDYSGSNKLFRAAALAGEAGYYADKKDYEKAADLYVKASKVSEHNVQNSEYLLNAGVNYLSADKNEMAKDIFSKIKKDYGNSPEARNINQYLVALN